MHMTLPIALNSTHAIPDNRASVVRSPRLAAMGVATLSGLMLHHRDNSTTPTIMLPVKDAA